MKKRNLLIEQWGIAATSNNWDADITINFPIKYNNEPIINITDIEAIADSNTCHFGCKIKSVALDSFIARVYSYSNKNSWYARSDFEN